MTYQIPISIPSGSAGVSPEVSFTYNSHAGNGLLGVGWNISGHSAISRCRPTLSQDGEVAAIKFNRQDKFCLDGQRLIVIDGEYGANGAEYRTEIDSQTRIVSWGNSGEGPEWFKVKRADGTVAHYGDSTDARLLVSNQNGTVIQWSQNRLYDSAGNYIDYRYDNNIDKGVSYLKEIAYTGHINGQAPYNRVEFHYQSRNDRSIAYIAGTKRLIDKRLASVKVYDSERLYRVYKLSYDTLDKADQRSQLNKVSVCLDEESSRCLQPTVFEWQDHKPNDFSSIGTIATGYGIPRVLPLDINGDGYVDFVFLKNAGSSEDVESESTITFDIFLGQQDGSLVKGPTTNMTNVGVSVRPDLNETIMENSLRVLDFDGDGYHDLMFLRRQSHSSYMHWYLARSNGTQLETATSLFNTWLNVPQGNSQSVSDGMHAINSHIRSMQSVDFHGDGIADLLYRNSGGFLKTRKIDQDGLHSERPLRFDYAELDALNPNGEGFPDQITMSKQLVVGDFNGDGRSDFLRRVSRHWDLNDNDGVDWDVEEPGDPEDLQDPEHWSYHQWSLFVMDGLDNHHNPVFVEKEMA
jgi:hypothetical protein